MDTRCISCGMPMTKPEEFGGGNTKNNYCVYCARPDGSMKSRQQVLEGMTAFIVRTQGIDVEAARAAAQGLMAKQPAWRVGS